MILTRRPRSSRSRRSRFPDGSSVSGQQAGSIEIPEPFWATRYDAKSFPGSPHIRAGSANCQAFAYSVLRHFGRTIPDFRSSELWNDADHTFVIERYAPLDLMLFSRKRNAFGAHVGVFVGENSVLHLARYIGVPVIWNLRLFAETPFYRVMIGAKRTRK